MKSARCFLTLSFALIFSTSFAFPQDRPAVTAQPNTVYVGADGKFESAPDTAVLQFNVSVQDASSQAAFQGATKEVEQVRQVLRANGIEPKAASVGFLSVQPVYEWRPKQHVVGYRVTTDITLKLKDFAKIGPITQQLADANVSETQTLSYMLRTSTRRRRRRLKTPTGGRATRRRLWVAPAAGASENCFMRRSIRLKIRGS